MRLLLVRHGQTPSNVLGELDTAPLGAPLTLLGHSQAHAVPQALRPEEFSSIYASNLIRTQETARPLAADRGVDVPILDGLREIEAGDLEMRSDEHAQQLYVRTALSWAAGELGARMPGGPSGREFFDRFDAAVDQIVDRGDEAAVAFSHGAAIRTWVAARAANASPGFASTHSLDNTGMAVLERVGSRGWRLLDWSSRPIGGSVLADPRANDPTGETLEETGD